MLAAEITDPKNARAILLAASGLVALAVVLTVGTVWWWRRTKAEHPALGPLATMGQARWKAADPEERRRILDSMRPEAGAVDVVDGVDAVDAPDAPDAVDPLDAVDALDAVGDAAEPAEPASGSAESATASAE